MSRLERMKSYLPPHFAESPEVLAIIEDGNVRFEETSRIMDDVLDQNFVGTATWGMPKWEEELDLLPKSNDLATRRAEVISKLTSQTPTHYEAIENEINRFLKRPTSKVRLIYGRYAMDITMPLSDINEQTFTNLTDKVEEMKPAHLSANFATQKNFDLGLNIGGAVSEYQITNILTPKFEMQDLHSTISYGALVAKYETTQIETLPFTMPDLQISNTYGGAFSNYMRTTILSKEVV